MCITIESRIWLKQCKTYRHEKDYNACMGIWEYRQIPIGRCTTRRIIPLQSRGSNFYGTSMKPRACFAFAECIGNLTRTFHPCTHTLRKSMHVATTRTAMSYSTLRSRPNWPWTVRTMQDCRLNVPCDLTSRIDKRITLFPH